jgi:hypothetical protein
MFQEDTWIFAVPDPAVHPYHWHETCCHHWMLQSPEISSLVSNETLAYKIPYKPPYLQP